MKKTNEKKGRKPLQFFMSLFLPIVIIGGYFYPYLGFIVVGGIFCFMILSPFFGRLWCGWCCPMGSFHERFLAKISFNKEIPNLFRKSWFRWLVFILMMSLLTKRLIAAGTNAQAIAEAFRFMWIVSTSIAIAFGVWFKPRIWCRICPMATMQGIMSKSTYLLNISEDCIDCKLCNKVCPISSKPNKHKEGVLPSVECMRCFNCVENCPKKALSFKNINRR